MRRKLLALLLAAAGLVAAAVSASAATQSSARVSSAGPPAAAVTDPAGCSSEFFDGDPRLGPQELPEWGPVGAELIGYRRTGGLPVSTFLATYYNPAANNGAGGWNYPPDNGYVIGPDGQPLEFQLPLQPGLDMDRFGSEYGSFLAPAGLPYAMRSIPPQSLDGTPAATCNYHDYRVMKSFTVDAGPIAPWFAQPGGGLQYQLDGALVPGAPSRLNVLWLVTNGYRERIS